MSIFLKSSFVAAGVLLQILLLSCFCDDRALAGELHDVSDFDHLNPALSNQSPAFWIDRLRHPDDVLLTPPRIERLNEMIRTSFRAGVLLLDETELRSGERLRNHLLKDFEKLHHRFLSGGSVSRIRSWMALKRNMMLERIPDVLPVQFGVVVAYCDQRLLTTQEPVFSDPETLDIDRVQNSALDIGTPVRILHESRDGRWWYVHCDVSAGWVKKVAVAVCDSGMVRRFVAPQMPVVSIKPRAMVFRDTPGAQFHGFLRMGAVLPWAGQMERDVVHVWIPRIDANGNLVLSLGYCPAADFHIGFLPMTARNILEQAFRMLDAPYGWGDMRQAQDCSRFMQEIFATTGLMLPRNSADQAKVIRTVVTFEPRAGCDERKIRILQEVDPGASLLYMKGHILLYIGSIGDEIYVIHAAHGYRLPDARTGEDRFIRLSRVVVSDLELGKGSGHGSLCDRLISVHTFKEPGQDPYIPPVGEEGES